MEDRAAARRDERGLFTGGRFLVTSLLGSLAMGLVCAFAPPEAQLAALGSWVSILAGLVFSVSGRQEEREKGRDQLLVRLGVPVALAREPDLSARYADLSDALAAIARSADPVLRDVAGLKLAAIVEEAQGLAAGRLAFHGTESWRAVYERILDRPAIKSYRSSAWVRTSGYWQDPAGLRSMQLNFALARGGVRVERVVILPDTLWPESRALPVGPVRRWLDEQRRNGIQLYLARERSFAREPDLPADFGIYGSTATGTHELDLSGNTLRYVLDFDPNGLALARDRWTRLLLHSTPYVGTGPEEARRG